MTSSMPRRQQRPRELFDRLRRKIETTVPSYVTNGILAGIIGTLASGFPTTLTMMFKTDSWRELFRDYILYSLQATGSILLSEKTYSKETLIAAGIFANLGVSVGVGILLSYLTRNMRNATSIIAECAAVAFLMHYMNVLMMPKVLQLPLLNHVVNTTGKVPQALDFLAHGAGVGATLAWLKGRGGMGGGGIGGAISSLGERLEREVAEMGKKIEETVGSTSVPSSAASSTNAPPTTATTATAGGASTEKSTIPAGQTLTGKEGKPQRLGEDDVGALPSVTTSRDKKRF